jgi:hypothetical protein
MRKRGQGRNLLFTKRLVLCRHDRDLHAFVSPISRLSRYDFHRHRVGRGNSTLKHSAVGSSNTEEFAGRWEPFELMAAESWRSDEMYIPVNGGVPSLRRMGMRNEYRRLGLALIDSTRLTMPEHHRQFILHRLA